jgi:hypothetical protein
MTDKIDDMKISKAILVAKEGLEAGAPEPIVRWAISCHGFSSRQIDSIIAWAKQSK